jgi:hypothetical protein
MLSCCGKCTRTLARCGYSGLESVWRSRVSPERGHLGNAPALWRDAATVDLNLFGVAAFRQNAGPSAAL